MKTKRRIGRKIISFLTTAAMVVGMMAGMTVPAYAEEISYNLWVGGTQVTSANASNIDGNNKMSYDDATKTLTLDNFSYSGSAGKSTNDYRPAYIYTTEALNISLSGTNSIQNTASFSGYPIYTTNDVYINGSGTLNAKGFTAIISTNGKVIIEGATVTATGDSSSGRGISSQNEFSITNGAKVTATALYGLYCVSSDLKIEESTVNASGNVAGIYCQDNNKNIFIKAGSTVEVSGKNYAMKAGQGVTNDITGTGWTNTEGTEGKANIEISSEGQSLDIYKKVQFPGVESYPVWAGGKQFDADNLTIEGDSGTATYDPVSKTLTLNGYASDDELDFAPDGVQWNSFAVIHSDEDLTINLVGDNKITALNERSHSAISMPDGKTLTIAGEGSLDASGYYGISTAKSYLRIKEGTINLTGYAYGINCSNSSTVTDNESIIISGGNVTATAIGEDWGNGITSTGYIAVTDGKLYAQAKDSSRAINSQIRIGSGMTGLQSNDGSEWTSLDPSEIKQGYYAVSKKLAKFEVEKTDVTIATKPEARQLEYTGTAQELVTEGEAEGGTMKYALGKDSDTEPTDGWSTDIPTGKEAGTYYVWYKAAATSDGYVDSDADKVAVTIEKKSIEKATVTLDNSSITYTGEELKVAVDKVTIGETELTEDDYEVSGTTAATEVGTYKVTVTGKGNYAGTATAEWKITSADDIFTDVQKPSAKSSLKYTGSALELVNAPTEKLPEGYKMTYALGENETDAPTSDDWGEYIPTETNAGTYYVWYKISDGAGNDVLKTCIPVTIAKATPSYDIPTGLTAVKGQTLADVDLPEADNGTWKWVDAETTSVGEVGENKFKVIFVPDDTDNYEEVKNVEVTITVTDPKTPDEPETPDNPDTPDKPDSEDKTDKEKNADIAIGDEDKKKTGITDIISKDLDDYAKNQAGNNVQVTMKVTAKDVDSVDSETANFMMDMVNETYEGMDTDEVKNEYLDISITKSIDGGSEEEVKDLGRVIEIAVSYDLKGKYNPVILREHGGEVAKFKRLDSRATGTKEDGTFYVDEDNQVIYIYAQYFSTYSIAYTTVPSYQITLDDGNGNVNQIVVANGATITEPEAPKKEGYKFLGWYVGDTKYDFTTPVTGKLTLTAKWEKIITPEINVLVRKQKVFGRNYFEKYGEELSKYKYKFKIDDKSQKKILGATKDMIKAKNAGTAKAALYRKTRKGGSWEKIEEVEFVVEKPEVTKKVTTLKPGDTAEALSFVTNQISVKPTYYLSSKPEVAEVDFETGKIKVLKKGSTTITIAYDNGIGAAKYKTKLVVK